MLDWLYEGNPAVYLTLAGLAAIVVALWWREGFVLWSERDNRAVPEKKGGRVDLLSLIAEDKGEKGTGKGGRLALPPVALALLGLLALGTFLADRLVETRREQIGRKLVEMAGAVRARDAGRIFQHISEQFRHESYNRDTFRRSVESALRNNLVNEVIVWDVKVGEGGGVEFMAKPRGGVAGENVGFPVFAEFVRDPDGQWRMRGFTVFKPYVDSKEKMSIVPYLP
jgi:hypothetical protein